MKALASSFVLLATLPSAPSTDGKRLLWQDGHKLRLWTLSTGLRRTFALDKGCGLRATGNGVMAIVCADTAEVVDTATLDEKNVPVYDGHLFGVGRRWVASVGAGDCDRCSTIVYRN